MAKLVDQPLGRVEEGQRYKCPSGQCKAQQEFGCFQVEQVPEQKGFHKSPQRSNNEHNDQQEPNGLRLEQRFEIAPHIAGRGGHFNVHHAGHYQSDQDESVEKVEGWGVVGVELVQTITQMIHEQSTDGREYARGQDGPETDVAKRFTMLLAQCNGRGIEQSVTYSRRYLEDNSKSKVDAKDYKVSRFFLIT